MGEHLVHGGMRVGLEVLSATESVPSIGNSVPDVTNSERSRDTAQVETSCVRQPESEPGLLNHENQSSSNAWSEIEVVHPKVQLDVLELALHVQLSWCW